MSAEITDEVALPPQDTAVPRGAVTGAAAPADRHRWGMLIAGVAVMILLSNYQYCFTLFTPGMKQQFTGVPYSQIALIFSIFVLFETWPVPVVGGPGTVAMFHPNLVHGSGHNMSTHARWHLYFVYNAVSNVMAPVKDPRPAYKASRKAIPLQLRAKESILEFA